MTGNVLNAIDAMFKLPRPKYEFADVRLATCRRCDKCTWLSPSDYIAYLSSHKVAVVTNISDLSVLPELPKQEYEKGKRLFCRICKCWLPAKAMVASEKCPLDKWPKIVSDPVV